MYLRILEIDLSKLKNKLGQQKKVGKDVKPRAKPLMQYRLGWTGLNSGWTVYRTI